MSQMSLNLSENQAGEPGLTQALQKGLILSKDGIPLCEEGMGFGVPVLVVNRQTFLSFTGTITDYSNNGDYIINKTYFFDALERSSFNDQEINNPLYYTWVEIRGKIYKNFRPIQKFLSIWMNFQKKAGFQFFFKKINPVSVISVYYHLKAKPLKIEVNLKEVRKIPGKVRLYILNEQGATNFPFYQDSNGLSLAGSKIGGWSKVSSDKACFSNQNKSISFCLNNYKYTKLYRGWEYFQEQLSWAGLNYDISNYREPVFSYPIYLKPSTN